MKPTKKVLQAFSKARQVRARAYAPYSKFRVGAAVISDSGKIFSGCNVENVSYGGTICAERTAIFKAVSEGAKRFSDVVVVAQHEHPVPPCAFCLQVIAEFCSPSTRVWIASPSKIREVYAFSELLPKSFGPGFLKK